MSAPKLRTAAADGVFTITLDELQQRLFESDDAKEGLKANRAY